jgi:hypothetical protein
MYLQVKRAWMTRIIFIKLLRALDASMGVQSRKILLFVDSCAAYLQDTSFAKKAKVAYYPPNCTSMLQYLYVDIIKCFKQYYRKRLAQNAVCCMDSGKNIKLKISVLAAIYFTLTA